MFLRRYASNNELAFRHILVSGRATVSLPYMSASYSHNMGGVDRFDRKLASWEKVMKSKKWWFLIFILFIHEIKLNAFVYKYAKPLSETARSVHSVPVHLGSLQIAC